MSAQLQLFKALRPASTETKNEWYTPTRYIEAARETMGAIDLDPASCAEANEAVRAAKIFTIHDNGLMRHWSGRVWMNPPYSPTPQPWVDKLIVEYKHGAVTEAILLVPPKVDTTWFAPLFEYPICFANHRIKFWGQPGSSNTFGSAFVYIGKRPAKFYDAFAWVGPVMRKVER